MTDDAVTSLDPAAVSHDGRREWMNPEAASELAMELTLMSRAMFSHLLPDAGSYAVSGVHAAGFPLTPAGAEVTAAEHPAHMPAAPVDGPGATGDVGAHSLAVPMHEGVAAPVSVPEADSPKPGAATVPGVPAPGAAATLEVPSLEPVGSSGLTEPPSMSVPQLEVPGLEPAGATAAAVAVPPAESSQPLDSPSLEVPSLALPGAAAPPPAAHAPEPAPELDVEADGVPVPQLSRSPHRPDRSMAMLAEIGFLDE